MSPLENVVDLLEHHPARPLLDAARDVRRQTKLGGRGDDLVARAPGAVDRESAPHVERRVGGGRRHVRLLDQEREYLGNLR
jgi:hypothetical protein